MKKDNIFIIAGLGNPGKKYENSRHNMGFQVIDELAELWYLAKFRRRFSSLCLITKKYGYKIIIIKPQTFMNNSGRAVKKALSFYKISPQNVIVIYDDIDLPVGSLRIRKNGGPGTHNGMRSITGHIGNDFIRIRIGIGKDKNDLINYVLSKPSKSERKLLNETIINSAEAVDMVIGTGIEKAMQEYNKK